MYMIHVFDVYCIFQKRQSLLFSPSIESLLPLNLSRFKMAGRWTCPGSKRNYQLRDSGVEIIYMQNDITAKPRGFHRSQSLRDVTGIACSTIWWKMESLNPTSQLNVVICLRCIPAAAGQIIHITSRNIVPSLHSSYSTPGDDVLFDDTSCLYPHITQSQNE